MIDAATKLAFFGIAVPLFGLAGSAIAYVIKLYQDAAERRRKNFFELMTFIDGSGPIAAKVAAVYALREYPEHREFVERFCTTQRGNVSGAAANALVAEFDKTLEYVRAKK